MGLHVGEYTGVKSIKSLTAIMQENNVTERLSEKPDEPISASKSYSYGLPCYLLVTEATAVN